MHRTGIISDDNAGASAQGRQFGERRSSREINRRLTAMSDLRRHIAFRLGPNQDRLQSNGKEPPGQERHSVPQAIAFQAAEVTLPGTKSAIWSGN